ncbi:MAG: FAD-dependent monooxygenase [Myxococcaceae bacterium]|nr:FAD-dependent monooxygenase [Myxococcaceae bacterium]
MGGGPAGLYSALLLKKAYPQLDVDVYEKNKPDDTFGWGVVFSRETLGTLEAADPESYRAVEARFAYWDDIEVHANGQVTTSTGHGFCGLARRDLLAILHERCAQLGVTVHFQQELPVEPLPKADLVIACDGVHSPLRERYAADFKPSIDWRRCKFTWLGTTKPLRAFTFFFKDTPHGLFQVHAYPFTKTPMQPSGAVSTFIVECREEVWKNAGLDGASEADTVAFLEKLFADELEGHRLCPNKSIWRTFPTIRCERWVRGPMVLMGDAVHTAHYSIGSGTKLAMEDAIALRDAFVAVGGFDVPKALARYEAERQPEVARLQKAAQTSLEWFENSARYTPLHPLQLTFSLMTRSKRITWDNLRTRDPRLVAQVDAWFADRAGSKRNSDGTPPPPLFAPLKLREVTLENRVVVSPMCQYSATDGVPDDWHLVHLGSRAVGGAGLVLTEMTNVSAEGRITHGCAGLWNDAQQAAWKRVVDFVHANSSARVGVQLAHAGRKASCQRPWEGDGPLKANEQPWQTLGPSALPFGKGWHTPKQMDAADLSRVKQQFVDATKRAEAAGFDVIELHLAHGYLLSSFLSPLSNTRTDEYGGSLERRMRYPLEVYDAVRAVWPTHKPMFVRVSASDWLGADGMTVEDTVVLAKALEARGCDVIDVSSGGNVPESKPDYGRMYQVPFAEAVKVNTSRLAVMAVGAIQGADHANTVIAAGRADLCALARPHLSDPSLVHRHAQAEGVDSLAWPKQYLAVRPTRRAQTL